eukprot:TRINITY_DN1380_c2_g1_i1.p2 TRINITY_DN1380_c2_g1~~TRINITY_DN1380_c2_g1_i1.p2  ORF type:complete len:179 (+),score=47.39 TRINITY_DN1380_c2_g1_i1:2429-2965(+)
MPPKKNNNNNNNSDAFPSKTVLLEVGLLHSNEKLDTFLAAFIPFLSKTKISKCVQGKGAPTPSPGQPTIGSVELVVPDGKPVKMKMPGKPVAAGEKYNVTFLHPMKNIEQQIADAKAALAGQEEEKAKLYADCADINVSLEQKKAPPKNSWMHKDGGERAKLSDRENTCVGGKYHNHD